MASMELKSVMVVLCLVGMCVAYPTGAPPEQCGGQMPSHGVGVVEQGGNAPYTVMVNDGYYRPGVNEMVTVTATNGGNLKGLLCQARKVSGGETGVGTFDLTNSVGNLKTLTCNSVDNSAVTHTENSDKETVSFYWVPPTSDMGGVKVMCTIVKVQVEFWMGVISMPMMYNETTPDNDNSVSQVTGSPLVFVISAVMALLVKMLH